MTKDWMQDRPEVAATVCFDGHVQTYSGQGRLARHFVSRQNACLPAAASYWLNALGGQPFVCLHVDVDKGLVQTLRDDVLPELRARGCLPAPGPDLTAPGAGPPVLTVVFDREGWCCIPQSFVVPVSHWAGETLPQERNDPELAMISINAARAA